MHIRAISVCALAFALAAGPASAASLTVPFDFSRNEVALSVRVKGTPAFMLLDTGVDPSAIDIARADALHLKVDRKAGGEVSGQGGARHAMAFPATIGGLSIGQQEFPPIDALAVDLSAISKRYGRPVDGVLGFSFLNGRAVLVDYPARRVSIAGSAAELNGDAKRCAVHWSMELFSYKDDAIPIIRDFRFGSAHASISLDTGSSGGISLYRDALTLSGMNAALTEKGTIASVGARGESTSKTYLLNESVGFGPFALPAGQTVALMTAKSFSDPRVANIGNKLFAALKLMVLLDYKARQMIFYGGCP